MVQNWSTMQQQKSQHVHHHSAAEIAAHFTSKVDSVRAATANASAPVINSRRTTALSRLDELTPDEASKLLSTAPSKHCQLDPVLTWLLKQVSDVIVPVLMLICNASFFAGRLPQSQKQAIVSARLKKPTLDPDDLNSYRPISNLSFVSKFVERAVAGRFVRHCEEHHLHPAKQSAYRRFHSTETAVLVVYNDIVRAVDSGQLVPLVLLDLSSAFDTVDHDCLLTILRNRFTVEGRAMDWFQSYLTERTQTFTRLRPIPVLGIGIGPIPAVSGGIGYRRYCSRSADTSRPSLQ